MNSVQEQAVVTANGLELSNLLSLEFRRDYAKGVSTFSFSLAEDPYGADTGYPRFDTGTEVSIMFAGQMAMPKGVITTVSKSLDKDGYQVVYVGQSINYTATQGSIDLKQGNYNGYTLEQAAKAVLQPLGINFTLKPDTDSAATPFPTLSPNPGDSPAEFISRMAISRGLFISDDGQGGILADRKNASGSASNVTLSEGKEIISVSCTMENDDVASVQRSVSQTKGSDTNFPPRGFSASSQQSGGIANVVNYFIAEHPLDADALRVRAEHENAMSQWLKFTCNITVIGWTSPDGQLWDPTRNLKITVYSPRLFDAAPYSKECALQAVTMHQDAHNGSISELELVLYNLQNKFAGIGDGAGAAGSGGGGGDSGDGGSVPSAKADPIDTSAITDQDYNNLSPQEQAQVNQAQDAADDAKDYSTTASKQEFPKDTDTGDTFDPDTNKDGVTTT